MKGIIFKAASRRSIAGLSAILESAGDRDSSGSGISSDHAMLAQPRANVMHGVLKLVLIVTAGGFQPCA